MKRLLLILLLASCAVVREGGFQVRSNVPEAHVLIDDVLVGRVSDWSQPGRAIRAGFHRIEIRHPGHHSHFAEIDLRDGGTAVIEAELHPTLD